MKYYLLMEKRFHCKKILKILSNYVTLFVRSDLENRYIL